MAPGRGLLLPIFKQALNKKGTNEASSCDTATLKNTIMNFAIRPENDCRKNHIPKDV
jgi:hypothetical protein